MHIEINCQAFGIRKIKPINNITRGQLFESKRIYSKNKRHFNKHIYDTYKEKQENSIKTRQIRAEIVLAKFKTFIENKIYKG